MKARYLELNVSVVYIGTLDEIVPILLDKSKATLSPAILYLNKLNYTLVQPTEDAAAMVCRTDLNEKKFKIVIVYNANTVRKTVSCR